MILEEQKRLKVDHLGCTPGTIANTSSCAKRNVKAKKMHFFKCVFHTCVQARRNHQLENKCLLPNLAQNISTLFFESTLSGNMWLEGYESMSIGDEGR